ncbi:MAG: hypothetical protein WCR52_01640 [Bacteroidota bacterium]
MKTWSRICFIAVLSFVTVSVNAQTLIDYVWGQHNIAFTLPNDFKVVTNTGDEFTASGDGMEFGIFPFSDESVDHSNITAFTIAIAKSLELEQMDDVDVIELNGLKGAYVEGHKDGARLFVTGFIDPESATNFFSVISFANDDKEAVNETVRIVKSFRKKK